MFCDCLSIHRLAAEVRAAAVEARVTDVHQSTDLSLVFHFRRAGETVAVSLSADARLARIHLGEKPFDPATPPPGFCQLLRQRLVGARLTQAVQVGGDRLVELTFVGRDDLGDRRTFFLVGEFMGRHSNLVLLDERRVIVEAVKRVPARVNRFRVVLPGKVYVPPPSPPVDLLRAAPVDLTSLLDRWSRGEERATPALAVRYLAAGLGRLLTEEVCCRAGLDLQAPLRTAGERERLAAALGEVVGEAVRDSTPPVMLPAERPDRPPMFAPLPLQTHSEAVAWEGPSLSSLVAHCAQAEYEHQARSGKTGGVTGQARKLLRQFNRQRERLQAELSRAKEADLDRRKGQALLAQLRSIPRGVDRVDLTCPETGEQLVIELDPALSPAANAQRYFARRRKRLRAQDQLPRRLRETESRVARLEELLRKIDGPEAESAVEELARLVEQETPSSVKVRGPGSGEEITVFTRIRLKSGLEAVIGRSARENELLLSRVARPNDLWFHVRGLPGPHGLLRTPDRSHVAPEAAIREMARLMARRGKAGKQTTVAVDYCPAKYVRKVRGGAPGAVTYSRHRTLFVKNTPSHK